MQLGSLQYPHNPMKGASEYFHFLSVLAGTYDQRLAEKARRRGDCAWKGRCYLRVYL